MPHYILGISAHYHDSSACLLRDGKIIAAAQEERFTRKKQDEDFPIQAIQYCLQESGISIDQVDQVAYYEKPLLKFERLLKTYIRTWPLGFRSFVKAMITWLGKKLWIESEIRKSLGELSDKRDKKDRPIPFARTLSFVPHHLSHAASTYYTSGFSDATVLTVDGVGEWATTTIGVGKGSALNLRKEIHFPDSLGLLYSAFTYYLGFKVNSAEYKVMGLAPYGKPVWKEKIYALLKVFEDGSFSLDQRYFTYQHTLRMVGAKFAKHFGQPVRAGEDQPLTEFHKDMAASLQVVTEELMLGLVKEAHHLNPSANLCLAGGVALNCVANGRIVRESPFQNVFIFPASGDAGGSVGAALYLHYQVLENPYTPERISTPFLGPSFSEKEIEDLLEIHQISFTKVSDQERASAIAELLSQDKVIGHFAGRMEFGPRALGHRSILADPRNQENWKRVNLKIKFRESFRPFAPAVLAEKSQAYFDLPSGINSPYMLLTAQSKVDTIPAVTHVDGSARVQTVSKDDNPLFYDIVHAFEKQTGCPVIINTSFNVRGEPIVCTPLDALKGFIRTDMDIVVLGNHIVDAAVVDKEALRKQFVLETFEAD